MVIFNAAPMCRYEDKEVQRDKKLVSYDIVDKQSKPYVKVNVNGEDKVCQIRLSSAVRQYLRQGSFYW